MKYTSVRLSTPTNSTSYLAKVGQQNLGLAAYFSDVIRPIIVLESSLQESNKLIVLASNDLNGLTSLHQEIIQEALSISIPSGINEWDVSDFLAWRAGQLNIDEFKSQWVCGYKEVINTAALRFHIPAKLLAAVAMVEVGGKPSEADEAGYLARINGLDPKKIPADQTSFGVLSIQIRVAARALGYDPDNLTVKQNSYVMASLRDPRINVYVAAKYLSDLREEYLPLKDDYQTVTEREMQALAGAYNRGAAYETLEDFWKTNYAQYGVKGFNALKNSGCWGEF